MNFFGTAPTKSNGKKDPNDPKEQAREWKKNLNRVNFVCVACVIYCLLIYLFDYRR